MIFVNENANFSDSIRDFYEFYIEVSDVNFMINFIL